MPVISKETAQRHLDMWLEAEAAVSTGQSYQIEQMQLQQMQLLAQMKRELARLATTDQARPNIS